MKYFRRIRLGFEDHKMESEFLNLKKTMVSQDYQIMVVFLVLFMLVAALLEISEDQKEGFFINLGVAIVILSTCIIKKFFQKHINWIILLTLIIYNFNRAFVFARNYSDYGKSSFFFRGYNFASFEIIIIGCFSQLTPKIIAMIGVYAIKFATIGVHNPHTLRPISLFLQILVDGLVIFVYYSFERRERKLFQSSYQHKEELLKFKDLLANDLPQSITVLKSDATKPLFTNKAFLDIYEKFNDSPNLETEVESLLPSTALKTGKFSLEALKVDTNSIREVGSRQFNQALGDSVANIRDVVKRLVEQGMLNLKAVTLSASLGQGALRKLFEITLKKIKWDTEDAVAIVFNDITHQEHLLAFKIADANKNKILATVSHELKTPLNAITSTIKLAKAMVDNNQVLDYLTICKDNADLLLSLVNCLLDFQLAINGELKVNSRRIEIRPILDSIIRLFYFPCKEKGLYLESIVNSDVPEYIDSDEDRLRQILINLIGNAVKFTFQGGIKVTVSQEVEDQERIKICVQDTGVGIKEEDKERLFKVYGKLGEETDSVSKNGVGFGLTMANTLVDALNGLSGQQAICLESVFGEGSTFCFEILTDLQGFLAKKENNRLEEITEDAEKEAMEMDENIGTIYQEQKNICENSTVPGDFEEYFTSQQEQSIKHRIDIYHLKERTSMQDLKLGRLQTDSFGRMQSDDPLTPGSPKKISGLNKRLDTLGYFKTAKDSFAQLPHVGSPVDRGCILIVDDNPFNLLVADNLIKSVGFTTKTAIGGREAIEAVVNRTNELKKFKAILMDCQMPVIDGFETTIALKKMMEAGEIDETPIFALTANNSDKDVERCLECGMSGHLAKPLLITSLMKLLDGLK